MAEGAVYDDGLEELGVEDPLEEPALLTLDLPAVGESVREARRQLVAFTLEHGGSKETAANVALCVSEAVTNAVIHGSGRDPSRTVAVVADALDGAIEMVVLDEGPGLAARVRSEGLGLGLGIIAQSAARFAVRDLAPNGTEVWMRFELP